MVAMTPWVPEHVDEGPPKRTINARPVGYQESAHQIILQSCNPDNMQGPNIG
jgi:hypothetical protein